MRVPMADACMNVSMSAIGETSRAKAGCSKGSTYAKAVKLDLGTNTEPNIVHTSLQDHEVSYEDWETVILQDHEVLESDNSNDRNPY